jgi:glycerophosphoryl diester phosphodiesterase
VVEREAPQIETVYLTPRRKEGDDSQPRAVYAAGGRTWSPHFGDVDAAALVEARALRLKVVVWTVNEPADIGRMLDLGVDGIISDRPDRVRERMQARGMPLPAATPVAP